MIRMITRGLPTDMTERELTALFSAFGRVRGIKVTTDALSGTCRGFGFVEMEGHEARAAIAGLNGKELRGSLLRVEQEKKNAGPGQRRRR